MKASDFLMYATQIGLAGLLVWISVSLFRWNRLMTVMEAKLHEFDEKTSEIEAASLAKAAEEAP